MAARDMAGFIKAAVLAGLLVLALPLSLAAQSAGTLLTRARAAEARLDFTAALRDYAAAIAADPQDPAALVARAALHRKMNRPSLALSDLAAALAQIPDNPQAQVAKGDVLSDQKAYARAIEAYDVALETAPDDLTALIGRARAEIRLGLAQNALADYDRALALAPDDRRLGNERRALSIKLAGPAVADTVYDPAALMDPRYRVSEGDPAAPIDLIEIHAGNALDVDEILLPRARLAPALASGALHITHLFTYTGEDSAVWANLALICAGTDGFGAVYDRMTTPEAKAALATLDAGGGRGRFETLVADAYGAAGLDPALTDGCAFDLTHAVRYLAAWSNKHDALAWKGASIYDNWPGYVLGGKVVSADTVLAAIDAQSAPETEAPEMAETTAQTTAAGEATAGEPGGNGQAAGLPAAGAIVAGASETAPEALADQPAQNGRPAAPAAALTEIDAAMAPSPPGAATSGESGALPAVPAPAAVPDTALPTPAETAPPTGAEPAPEPAAQETSEVEAPAPAAPDQIAPIEANPVPAPAPRPAPPVAEPLAETDLRIPTELKGIWAPSLADCIAYTDAIAAPDRLDTALPALNGLDGPAIGTVLLTSRRMILFNVAETRCGLVATGGEAEGWSARLTCGNRLDPSVTTELSLQRLANDGVSPRLVASLGTAAPQPMLQCRALGRLSHDFSPLWQVSSAPCSATAPLRMAHISFAPGDGGSLVMSVQAPQIHGQGALSVSLDGAGLDAGPARITEGTAELSLGAFAPIADRLSQGLLLRLTWSGEDGTGAAFTLPLLGSGKAMAGLSACAPG